MPGESSGMPGEQRCLARGVKAIGRRPSTRASTVTVVLVVLSLVACGPSAPTPRPSAPQAEIDRIRAAFEALDDLDSYGWTFTGTPSVVLGDVTATVVNGDPFKLRYDIFVGERVVGSAVFIGDQTWQSVQGSPFRPDPELKLGPDDAMPFERTFLDPLVDATGTEVIRDETIEGRAATRLRVFIAPAEGRFEGIVNVWVDDQEGFLLRAEAAGTTRPGTGRRGASPVPLGATATVERINGTTNVVDPPI